MLRSQKAIKLDVFRVFVFISDDRVLYFITVRRLYELAMHALVLLSRCILKDMGWWSLPIAR